jgi:hypothetical protein
MTAAMDRARRSPLRFLAPVGLAVFFIAFLVVVTTADVSDNGDSNNDNERAEQRDLKGGDRGERRRNDREERLPDEVYIVKEGDTLDSISQKTGVSIQDLYDFNPGLDSQTLVTGQCVRLKETTRRCPKTSEPDSGLPQ